MPTTPLFGIQFPCESPSISLADFAAFATTTETAIATVDAEATAITHNANARGIGTASPAFGVETVLTYSAFAANFTSSQFTVNLAAGTLLPQVSGLYAVSVRIGGNSSSLTMTSQRVTMNINGSPVVASRGRGTNPAGPLALSTSFTSDVYLTAGVSSVTFSYLWTGTGVSGLVSATVALDLIATP